MQTTSTILKTLSAKCRDCYRCVRVCPVKAIGIKNSQAYVDSEKCIYCGTCVKECPQNAKVYRDDTEAVVALLKTSKVAASVAPSFSAIYDRALAKRLPSALRKLGFSFVSETSEGATIVTDRSKELISNPKTTAGVCTACPVVINYVEKYKSESIATLLPVVSPMVAHGKLLKHRLGQQVKVVFIGPCIAKKHEAERLEHRGAVDLVLTFTELNKLFTDYGIDLNHCPESDFDNASAIGDAKLFALPGGMLKTAGIEDDGIKKEIITTSGADNISMLFNMLAEDNELAIVEPLFCEGGCINGPGITSEKNIFKRRADLIHYARQKTRLPYKKPVATGIDLSTYFRKDLQLTDAITEQQIDQVYQMTDKANPAERLDCGACGYGSCREKAIAVIKGMAEIEMCMPYMRKLAELRTDRIIESSPSGIVILDDSLRIISMNPAFREYFSCGNAVLGKKISYLFDSQEYEKLATGTIEKSETVITNYGRKYQQIAYYIPSAHQYVGVYIDISGLKLTEEKLNRIKMQTVEQARELLDHQIEMAMTMAKFLGESTAKGEELVERLMNIYEK